ncbi:MAG: hypothetical protein VX438_14515 [Planctomycetota bacterium]|nr:hypothetical protein [Planctomycetota bacterium]
MRYSPKINQPQPLRQATRHRQGVVLFMVVSIILMMSLLVYAFLISMQAQSQAATQAGDQLQARQAAFSAREILCQFLESPYSDRMPLNESTPGESPLDSILMNFEGELPEELTARGFVLSGLTSFQSGVVNESAKINLQTLVSLDQANPGWGREVLLRLPEMTESIADHLLDWMDPDDEAREFGAESEFYLENFGFTPRNSVPPTLLEFTKIPEIKPEWISGVRSQPAQVDPFDNSNRKTDLAVESPPWSHFLTVNSAERNETFTGEPRLYLNGSNLAEIHTILTKKINIETANFVILARQYGTESQTSQGISNSSLAMKQPGEITIDLTQPAQFEISSLLDLLGTTVRIGDLESESIESESTETATYVQSPFSGQNTTLNESLESFLDGTTVFGAKTILGRVNISKAPREVLLSVPGIDEELASQIISTRRNHETTAKTSFWLLDAGLITMEQMKSISPYITQRGEICQALVGGRSDAISAPVVFETLLDATGETTRQIYSRRIVETHSIREFLNRLENNQSRKP